MSNKPRIDLIHPWYFFLRISPSYQIATLYKQGKIPLPEKINRPENFDLVIKMFDDFGDVWANSFDEWMGKKWEEIFTAFKPVTKTKSLGILLDGETNTYKNIQSNLKKYLSEDRAKLGHPATLILAIPINAKRKDIVSEIIVTLNQHQEFLLGNLDKIPAHKSKYSTQINKIRKNELGKLFDIIICKAKNPNWTLWQVAIELGFCLTYTKKIQESETYRLYAKEQGLKFDESKKAYYEKTIVNAVMGRHIRRAFLLAENAARGKFPSINELFGENNKKIKTNFDYKRIGELIVKKNQVDKALSDQR